MKNKLTAPLVIAAFLAGFLLHGKVAYINEHNNISSPTRISACFTPSMHCTEKIVNEINQAKKSIFVQAYSFTSVTIAESLARASLRGVDVRVILDKSQANYRYSVYPILVKNKIPVFIDSKPAIAHNKIIILDGKTIITGSFNFTAAAEQKNAENLLIIYNPTLALSYLENWRNRQALSKEYTEFIKSRKMHNIKKINDPNFNKNHAKKTNSR